MSLLFLDSFDHYQTAEITQKYSQIVIDNGGGPVITAAIGRRGSQAMRFTCSAAGGANSGNYIRFLVPGASGSTVIMGFAFKHTGPFAGNLRGLTFGSATNMVCGILNANVVQFWMRVEANGTLTVYRGSPGTLLGTTTLALSEAVYSYIEVKVVIHASAGTVTVKFDGIDALVLTGINTQAAAAAAWNEVSIGPTGETGISQDYDDLYIADGTGSRWNDFMGDMRIDAIYPNANGTTRNFTPSAGTDDFAVVDEALANGDTDYLTGATIGNKVTMNFPDAPVAGAVIHGLQVVCQARKTDAGSSGHKGVTRVSGVDYLSPVEKGLTSSYSMALAHFPENPATAAAWTDTVFNGAEFGAIKSS